MNDFEKAEKDIEWINYWASNDPIVYGAIDFFSQVLSKSVCISYGPNLKQNFSEYFTKIAAIEYFKFGKYKACVQHHEDRANYAFFSPNMEEDALLNLSLGQTPFTYKRPDKDGAILPLHKVLLRRLKLEDTQKNEIEYEELKQVLFRHFSNPAMIRDEVLHFRKSLELWATHANTVDKVKVSLNFTPFVEGDAERISAEYLKLHG